MEAAGNSMVKRRPSLPREGMGEVFIETGER